ncbi:hypothetical protein BJ875DRAFT_382895, partial [Amylocarpus encephaloides]
LTGHSAFFKAMLSGSWNLVQLADGAYFVDYDGTRFEFVLRYLRERVFPIFFDIEKGYDHVRYQEIWYAARYFQINDLQVWLEKRFYLRAVKVVHRVEVDPGITSSTDLRYELRGNSERIFFYPNWITRKVYFCPRGIAGHNVEPNKCGRKCRNALGEDGGCKDERLWQFIRFQRRMLINKNLCKDGWEAV